MTLAMKLHDVRYEGWQEGLEQGRSEGLQQGRSEGQRLAQVNMIKHMLSLNYSPEKISEITGYPLDEVNNIIAGL